MSRPEWKRAEARMAELFGTMRKPLSGGIGARRANRRNVINETASDSEHESLFLECKYSQKHALFTLWRKTAVKAKEEHRVPVVGLCEKGDGGVLLVINSKHMETVALEFLSTQGYTCLRKYEEGEDEDDIADEEAETEDMKTWEETKDLEKKRCVECGRLGDPLTMSASGCCEDCIPF